MSPLPSLLEMVTQPVAPSFSAAPFILRAPVPDSTLGPSSSSKASPFSRLRTSPLLESSSEVIAVASRHLYFGDHSFIVPFFKVTQPTLPSVEDRPCTRSGASAF